MKIRLLMFEQALVRGESGPIQRLHRLPSTLGLKVALLVIGLAVLSGTPGSAITTEEVQKLLASDGSAGDWFGHSVALDGDTAVIGAPYDSDNGYDSGSAYVFTRDASGVWVEQAKLVGSDTSSGDEFGGSVALDRDTVVVGARLHDRHSTDDGAAYVFTRGAGAVWSEQAKLVPADDISRKEFGVDVALDEDTVVIGAWMDYVNGMVFAGSAYVYVRDAAGVWVEQGRLTPSDGDWSDYFGGSVALDGNTAVIGAPYDDDNGGNSGSAYVFGRDASGAWSEQAKLVPSDGASGDTCGLSVALSGNTAVVDASFPLAGAAYVFTRDAGNVWSEQAKLVASDGRVGDRFGFSTALKGNTAVIGARHDFTHYLGDGSLYVFSRNSNDVWSERHKLLASDGAWDDYLGHSMAFDGFTAMTGAVGDDDNGDDSGSVYVFLPLARLHLTTDESLGAVSLSWEGGIAPFEVKRSSSPQGPWNSLTPEGGINDRTWMDEGVLTNGVDYFYRIETR